MEYQKTKFIALEILSIVLLIIMGLTLCAQFSALLKNVNGDTVPFFVLYIIDILFGITKLQNIQDASTIQMITIVAGVISMLFTCLIFESLRNLLRLVIKMENSAGESAHYLRLLASGQNSIK
ncbi:MAG: hypothetical protein ACRCUY_10535 [Thermoguttaceae bacterium]